MTGYTIYYQQEGGERRSLRTEAGGTTANISGLISGATYSITVEALSTFLPSNECLPYNITTTHLYIIIYIYMKHKMNLNGISVHSLANHGI